MKLGIDVSSHQSIIDWPLVARSGIGLAMVKATEGTDYVNPYYDSQVQGALDAGLIVGAYHYAKPSVSDAATEASHFTRVLDNSRAVILTALDLEDPGVVPGRDLSVWTETWLNDHEADTGHTARVYSNRSYIRDHAIANIVGVDRFQLWLAEWTTLLPTRVAPWRWINGWQFSSKNVWPGVGLVDLSLWDF